MSSKPSCHNFLLKMTFHGHIHLSINENSHILIAGRHNKFSLQILHNITSLVLARISDTEYKNRVEKSSRFHVNKKMTKGCQKLNIDQTKDRNIFSIPHKYCGGRQNFNQKLISGRPSKRCHSRYRFPSP